MTYYAPASLAKRNSWLDVGQAFSLQYDHKYQSINLPVINEATNNHELETRGSRNQKKEKKKQWKIINL